MIKTLLFTTTILFCTITFCQEESTIKAVGGEKTLELQLTPFGNTPININGIRARLFKSDKKAIRLNMFVGFDSERLFNTNSQNGIFADEIATNKIIIGVRPGFEKHIDVSEKLSPYFGVELETAFQRTTIKEVSGDFYDKFINGDRTGFWRLGLNAIAGIDYYIANKLYIGTEFGFGFSYTGFLKAIQESNRDSFVESDPQKQGSAFDLGPNVQSYIRLGYAF